MTDHPRRPYPDGRSGKLTPAETRRQDRIFVLALIACWAGFTAVGWILVQTRAYVQAWLWGTG